MCTALTWLLTMGDLRVTRDTPELRAAVRGVKDSIQRALDASVKVANKSCLWTVALAHQAGQLQPQDLMPRLNSFRGLSSKDARITLPEVDKVAAALKLWTKRQHDLARLHTRQQAGCFLLDYTCVIELAKPTVDGSLAVVADILPAAICEGTVVVGRLLAEPLPTVRRHPLIYAPASRSNAVCASWKLSSVAEDLVEGAQWMELVHAIRPGGPKAREANELMKHVQRLHDLGGKYEIQECLAGGRAHVAVDAMHAAYVCGLLRYPPSTHTCLVSLPVTSGSLLKWRPRSSKRMLACTCFRCGCTTCSARFTQPGWRWSSQPPAKRCAMRTPLSTSRKRT